MVYKISHTNSETLLEKPETGMGYQIVDAYPQFRKTEAKKFVVYNTNLAVELDSNFNINRKKIIDDGYEYALNKAEDIVLETSSIKVLALSEYTKKYNERHSSSGNGAADSPMEYANGTDCFVRVSAYEDDKRIDLEHMKLKAGSFTTTSEDYNNCVSTNGDPIDRYALPNDEEIKWSFYIKPKSSDILQKGVVQPAFNRAGGGIEVYFEEGTSENTYLYKKEYGK